MDPTRGDHVFDLFVTVLNQMQNSRADKIQLRIRTRVSSVNDKYVCFNLIQHIITIKIIIYRGCRSMSREVSD